MTTRTTTSVQRVIHMHGIVVEKSQCTEYNDESRYIAQRHVYKSTG
ncbi:hypothetical protein WG66_000046 [Moniliophthora roreri]|nr:hypothetical protein WG66_000046 [Moniliophthora roreri]